MYLSVIVPFYNEDDIIEHNILQICNYLKPKFKFEIIIVNDSGKKNVILQKLDNKLDKIRLINNNKNNGKGYSIREGVKISLGDTILLTDADLSTPIEELEKLYKNYKKDIYIVIGSRSSIDSEVLVKQPLHRIFAGRIYNLLIKIILRVKFNDTQCGFKLIKKSVLQDLIPLTKSKRFGLDIELIYFAKKKNYKVKEVGVKWKNRNKSSVSFFKDSLKMLYEILKLSLK